MFVNLIIIFIFGLLLFALYAVISSVVLRYRNRYRVVKSGAPRRRNPDSAQENYKGETFKAIQILEKQNP